MFTHIQGTVHFNSVVYIVAELNSSVGALYKVQTDCTHFSSVVQYNTLICSLLPKPPIH